MNSTAGKTATKGEVFSRIFLDTNGDMLVTDLWEELDHYIEKEGLGRRDEDL